ncbi:hypothetical protein DAPPUDRAFT_339194 [Daphnia pulex]|uniref:Uncharacterized protein n=1 Tax=Daphnia pulex TaxID=6669 RepID=E9I3C0_DAPPU|nr:hypothetical protein DAPPUDRAFT_339194 [Daphnia pulex]|eukprot:EFX61511.1 hypothetical protein DAPPUDRAFT_339194 [Daphnia pulex]
MDALDLEPVCSAIGYTATRKIAAWYGGQLLHVPQVVRTDHPLVALIGLRAVTALVNTWPGERFRIPDASDDDRYRRDRVIAEMLVAGATCAAIGQLMGITTRRVETLRAEMEQEGFLQFAEAPRLRSRGVPPGGSLPRPTLGVDIPAHRGAEPDPV